MQNLCPVDSSFSTNDTKPGHVTFPTPKQGSFLQLGTTGGLFHTPPPGTPPPSYKIGPNFLPGLPPIKNFLWRLWRQLV